jgi:Fe2+ transport system protein FeoA
MTPQARIEALKSAPPNGWIAFSEDEERVVAKGMIYDEVVELAEKNGVTDPIVVKVPENWNDRVLSV